MTKVEEQILLNQSAIMAAQIQMMQSDRSADHYMRDQLLLEYEKTGRLLRNATRGAIAIGSKE